MATATLKLSGYLAAAAAVSFTGTQTLDSLTDNEWTNLSDEIDNSSNLYAIVDLELELGSAAFTGTDSGIEIHLIPSVDGTNYPTWTGNGTSDEQENNLFYVGFITTTGTTAAQVGTLLRVPLPNGKYKWGVRSRANVTLASSGNALNWRPHTVTSVS